MKLFLCEKPSQGRDIARILQATKGDKTYKMTADGHVYVTWAIGHLVEQCSPEMYNEEWKFWTLENLPILPSRCVSGRWQVAPKEETKKQYNVVMQLIKKAQHVVIATDIDREGETIARELLELANFKGQVSRLWLSALDDTSIRKGLANLKRGEETLPLYYAGLARSRADWLVGMNFSRLFTLLAQQKGFQGVMSVGRVQSPTLALVVNRDNEIKNFTPKNHYKLVGMFSSNDGQFTAGLVMPKEIINEDGLCLEKQALVTIASRVQQQNTATVIGIEKKRKKENPPLVFNLSTLQADCNRLFGFGAQHVLDIAQSLYEKHKATTYPRSDCPYLPIEQFSEVPKIVAALLASDTILHPLQNVLNLQQKSRVWDNSKITAHHGIIPTIKQIDISLMTKEEFQVYDLIRRHYLAQFLPFCEVDQTDIILRAGNYTFATKGKVTINPGWKILLSRKENNEDEATLPKVVMNEQVVINSLDIKQLTTTPPPHFTEGTLLTAMVNAGRFVKDERLKKQLKETEGLGTEATRANLIQNLFDKKFIKKQGKSIIATPEGHTLIANLPLVLKDPATTALWEQALNQIAEGNLTLQDFMRKQEEFISMLVSQITKQGVNIGNINIKKCPKCGAALIKRKGKKGDFWGCRGYPACTYVENISVKKSKKRTARTSVV